MILASSNEGDTVLDPFSGSGTALRVCQNLNRNCIGIELNPEYVEMTKERLGKEFNGFDSIDERMERVPNDLNDEKIRNEYIENHKVWFLKNHESSLKDFINSVIEKYRFGRKNTGGMTHARKRQSFHQQREFSPHYQKMALYRSGYFHS